MPRIGRVGNITLEQARFLSVANRLRGQNFYFFLFFQRIPRNVSRRRSLSCSLKHEVHINPGNIFKRRRIRNDRMYYRIEGESDKKSVASRTLTLTGRAALREYYF